VGIVLLIRHGRTAANARGVLAGRAPGVSLDAEGRRQARSLGRRLRHVPLAVLVHSPLERCAQTAAGILAERTDAVPVREDVRLVECDYGAWSGRQLSELAREPLWAQVQAQPSSVVFPQGESMASMAARAVAATRDHAARHPDGVVALVSHGDVLKAVLSDALGQPFDEFQRIVLGPGSLSAVAYGRDRPMVLSMNDTGRRLRVGPHAPAAGPTVGGGDG
jgi:probable phosphomutase (TIGR03848 family)